MLLTNSTGSAFEQLVSDALGAGGMTQDTLVLQQKLAPRAKSRRRASSKGDTVKAEQERGDGPHGCCGRGLPVGARKKRSEQTGLSPKGAVSARHAGSMRSPEITCWTCSLE